MIIFIKKFTSKCILCSRSSMYSLDFSSSALMAASLSSSALRFSSSSLVIWCGSLGPLLRRSSSILSLRSSISYFLSSARWSTSSLILASFLIRFALIPNLRVEAVSENASGAGDTIISIVVLQLPPSESLSSLVSFESLYGMCDRGLTSVSAAMTLPSQDSDWLIFFDSSSRSPVAPVILTLSDPARSTRFSLPTLTCFDPSTVFICSTMMMKTACDLEETSFLFVHAVLRDIAPFCIKE